MSEQQYRFIVASAQEAVTVLRERIGENARVVSVRQIEGAGLARFLRAPKLEVIAEVVHPTPTEPAMAPAEEAPQSAQTQDREPQIPSSALARLLRAGGVSSKILGRLQSDPDWRTIEAMPSGRALTRVGISLRRQFHAIPRRPLGDRVAFLGSPGAGTTTALCKWAAAEVFVRQRRGVVLKLDLDRANPGDALAVFCEALGVRLARSISDVPTLDAGQFLFVDVAAGRESEHVVAALAPLFTTSRVLVINAAYDAALIKRAYQFAERAGCTHAVFTHLDEVPQWGRLWEFLLAQNLTPLFLGTGPNIAGDIEENVFDAVLAGTFPETGLQAA